VLEVFLCAVAKGQERLLKQLFEIQAIFLPIRSAFCFPKLAPFVRPPPIHFSEIQFRFSYSPRLFTSEQIAVHPRTIFGAGNGKLSVFAVARDLPNA
jgi:hypothetical protein